MGTRGLPPDHNAMRCGDMIGPESFVATRGLEVFIRVYFDSVNEFGDVHTWKYILLFRNIGSRSVFSSKSRLDM